MSESNGNGNGNGWGKVLTGQQRLFVDAWFETNCNGTEAARLAGYGGDDPSDQTLASTASRLLRNVKVQDEINARWAEKGMSGDEVIAHLAEIVRCNPGEFISDGGAIDWQMVQEKGHLIQEVIHHKGQRSTIKFYDKIKAMELIGKALGMFRDRVEYSGPGGGPLLIEYVNDWRAN